MEDLLFSLKILQINRMSTQTLKFWFVALQPFFHIIQDKLSVPFQVKLSKLVRKEKKADPIQKKMYLKITSKVALIPDL